MRYLILLLALLCVACGNYSANVPTLKPYKMDIQQGNVVTPKMMMQLRPGMSKSQVRFIMGTPLLTDSFHGDRWDYFYQMRKDGKIIEQRRVIIEFDGDSLAHVRGDVIPAGSDPATASQPKNTQPRAVVRPAKEKEKGLLDKLKFWGDDEEVKKDAPKEPATTPEPAPSSEPVPEAAPVPASASEAAPAPANESAPAPVAEPEPPAPAPAEPAQTEAVKQAAPAPNEPEQEKGLLDKLKFWGDEEKAPARAAPEVKPAEPTRPAPAAPVEQPAVEPAKARPVVAEPPPSPRRPSLPEARSKEAPKPPADLPPEDAPEFFEKMLEKIGF